MARISLRAYNGDIEAMVDKNQIDEAFAHCRYILQIYPKHIDTYRLMGKALLEAQRFGDAADVFHRVLSSVPDDFIAHLGMSIIREDESNLDAAIWHMERAFEVQPSNAAVQVELRRLYGLRDGITPQKIQLTRGALARMSAKSNLYSQAIAELRTSLSSDPQRPDLQVVLADMYFQTGANMEAIETCNSLINKLPYCLVANRILADVLPETERADQAAEYSSRLGELNPYYRHISPVSPTLEQVPDGAVTIERFEYSDKTGDVSQPAWATSLGVDFEDQEAEANQPAPDWLRESTPEGEPTPDGDQVEEEAFPPQGDLEPEQEPFTLDEQEPGADQIPDWMDEAGEIEEPAPSADLAGLGMAAGAAALGGVLSDQGEDEEAVPEPDSLESPEWMEAQQADLAPGEMEDSAEPVSEGEDLPDWMQGAEELPPAEDLEDLTVAAGTVAIEHAAEEILSEGETVEVDQGEETEEQLPEWMAEQITSEAVPEAVESETTPPPSEDDQEDETPDWISETADDQVTETPAWLREAMEESPPEDLEPSEDTAVDEIITEDLEAAGVEPEEQPAGEFPTEDEESLEAGQVVGAALAGAAIAAGLEGDEGDEDISEPDEEIPDWLRDLGDQVPDQPEIGEPAPVFDDQLEADLSPEITTEQATSEFEAAGEEPQPAAAVPDQAAGDMEQPLELASEFPESIPDWLSEVSPEEVSDELEESAEGMDIVKAEIPVWLKKMEAQHRAELAATGEYETPEDFETELTELSGEDVPTWLVSAMEPELAPETEADISVEDVSEIIAGPQPEEMEAEFIAEAEELVEEVQPEPAVEEVQPEPAVEEAELEAVVEEIELEAVLEEVEPEAAVEEAEPEAAVEEAEPELALEEMPTEAGQFETLVVEEPAGEVEAELESTYPDEPPVEIEPEEQLEPVQESTDEREGIGIGGLAAASAGVAALMDDEDTQPIPVTEEPEPVAAETEIVEEELAGIEAVEAVEAEEETEIPPTSELEADEDAAMAWLESLAAKQGAAEEELLTPADQRQEEPPEWIREAAAESEEPETDEKEAEPEGILAAAALAGVTESLIDEAEQPEEAEGPVEEEPSEWVPEILPESDLPVEVEDEPAGEVPEPSMETEEIAEEPGIVEELAAAAEVDLEEVEPVESGEEIPDWLSGLAEDQELSAEETEEAWTPPTMAEETLQPEEVPETAPLEKMDLNAASLAQLERIPGVGFIHAQNIIEYRSRSGPFSDFEQLENVAGLTPEMVADLQEYLTIELVPDLSPTESDIPELQSAWDHLNQGEIDQAVDQYAELINQDQHLDEIIRDLQAALGKYPLDSSLFQSLGDAYMHANMLQEALDAYNRAEDLLN